MRLARPAFALDPRDFGRGQSRLVAAEQPRVRALGDDARLFATTFAAGFLFVSVLIA